MSQWVFSNYCQKYFEYEKLDLVEVAKERNGIDIIVDYRAFRIVFIKLQIRYFVKKFGNEYLRFFLAEYDSISKSFYDLQKRFQEAQINLIWVSSDEDVNDPLINIDFEKWLQYTQKQKQKPNLLLEDLNGENKDEVHFPLVSREGTMAGIKGLKKAKAQVIQILEGDIDFFMMQELNRRKAFAIWTGNLKICLIPGSRAFMAEYKSKFKNKNDLEKYEKEMANLCENLQYFYCELLTHEMVLDHFHFTCNDQALILGILLGVLEIFNKDSINLLCHLRLILNKTQFPWSINVANYICKKGFRTIDDFVNDSTINDFLDENPNFWHAIEKIRDFKYYMDIIIISTINMPTDNQTLTTFIKKKICNFEADFLTLKRHLGKSYKVFSRNDHIGPFAIVEIDSEIIKQIWPFVIDNSISEITEWYSSDDNSFGRDIRTIPITHANVKMNKIVPILYHTGEEFTNILSGVDIFETIFSYLEIKGNLQFFEKFGIETGFICYLLRYLHRKYQSVNQILPESYFQALFCTAFYQHSLNKCEVFFDSIDKESFFSFKIKPSIECVNILKSYVSLFVAAKRDVGNVLNITYILPEPHHVISSSVFYAFFVIASGDYSSTNIRGRDDSYLLKEDCDKIVKLKNEILFRYQHHYNAIKNNITLF